LQTALKTDERIRLVNEIISSVQVIKSYAWEKLFCARVKLVRFQELKTIRKSSYIRGLFMTIFLSITRVALYLTILTMLALGEHVAIDRIFVIASYYNVLSFLLTGKFVRAFGEIAECKVSAGRIQSFLQLEEIQVSEIIDTPSKEPIKSEGIGNGK
jgi:ATP-binding cassette subfamily C (CFTR/MRP) protein 4